MDHELEGEACRLRPANLDLGIEESFSHVQVEFAHPHACRNVNTAGSSRANNYEIGNRAVRGHAGLVRLSQGSKVSRNKLQQLGKDRATMCHGLILLLFLVCCGQTHYAAKG